MKWLRSAYFGEREQRRLILFVFSVATERISFKNGTLALHVKLEQDLRPIVITEEIMTFDGEIEIYFFSLASQLSLLKMPNN